MIFVECKPDLVLVKSVTNFKRRDIAHEFKGKGKICNQLRRRINCIGLVDEDPAATQPRYVIEARLENDFSEYDIKVLRHSPNDNRLILLRPRLEEWILKAARDEDIDVRKYNLT